MITNKTIAVCVLSASCLAGTAQADCDAPQPVGNDEVGYVTQDVGGNYVLEVAYSSYPQAPLDECIWVQTEWQVAPSESDFVGYDFHSYQIDPDYRRVTDERLADLAYHAAPYHTPANPGQDTIVVLDPARLAPGSDYRWRSRIVYAQAVEGSGETFYATSPWSETIGFMSGFTAGGECLAFPALVANKPADGATFTRTRRPALEINNPHPDVVDVCGWTETELELATVDESGERLGRSRTLSYPTFGNSRNRHQVPIMDDLEDGIYAWRARAVAANGAMGNWSTPARFVIAGSW